jgi:hypothetical protein
LTRSYAYYETDALAAALVSAGYAVIPGVLSREACSTACAMIDALQPVHWDEVHAHSQVPAAGRRLDRYLCVFNREPYWLQFIDLPGIAELAEHVLGTDCHIIGETAWRTHPGYRGDPLHVDYLPPRAGDAATPHVSPPLFIFTAHYYLTDVGHDCAPTRIVPGSHRSRRAPGPGETSWNARGADTLVVNAGDCVVFRSDVWHAGGDNTTATSTRYLLQVHYGRREMAQHFSPFLDWRHDPHVLAAATPRQRRLLGDHAPGPYD